MNTITAFILTLAALGAAGCNDQSNPVDPSYGQGGADAGGPRGFRLSGIARGAPTGAVFLNGGGSFEPLTATDVVPHDTRIHAGGDFSCLAAVQQGPLGGCAAEEGTRWQARQLLATTTFKCTGADTLKTAATSTGTVVFLAAFRRAGDGESPALTARVLVSATDIAPDLPGDQTLWVQGVGCGNGRVRIAR